MNVHDTSIQTLKGRVKLSSEELIQHYFFVVPILTLLYFLLPLNDMLSHGNAGYVPFVELLMSAVAVYFLYVKYKRLKFSMLEVNLNANGFRSAAKATAREMEWEIECLTDDVLVARGNLHWQWSGSKITLIRKQGVLYANSIIYPSYRSNPFSMGWNKRNIKVILHNMRLAARGEDVELLVGKQFATKKNSRGK